VKIRTNPGRLAASLVAATSLICLGALPASAAPVDARLAHPDGCPPDGSYAYSGVTNQYVDIVPPASGSPGTPLTINLTAGLGITGTVGGQVSGDVNAIVAGAQASVNASLSLSWTASVTYSGGPWTVPNGVHVGYLHAGGQRESMTWQYGSYTGACRWVVSRSGTARLPWQAPAFWHTTA